jgi:DNA recombination protein RmuC
MTEVLLFIVIALQAAVIGLLLLMRRGGADAGAPQGLADMIASGLERSERALREEMARSREESATAARAGREEFAASMKSFADTVTRRLTEIAMLTKSELETFGGKLERLTSSNEQKLDRLIGSNEKKLDAVREAVEQKLEAVRLAVEAKLAQIQADNAARLEEMRKTVDEKLSGTLDKRLGESFRLVSERLEQVHKGLGEMQTLANGVGDLKKVLTNVKTRGTWGEIQLGSLLEQILAPEQFERNVCTREGSKDVVEFAIRLPGREDADGAVVYLPIDAKFPQEDYQRLLVAQDAGDAVAAEAAAQQLELRIRGCAQDICDKYLSPPKTTDFGIMFLPTEGLYAEVIRRPGLMERLQNDCRVVVAGPTTLAALLNSLQMGFRTLAIQKRSSEVWVVLGAVKTEFGRFGEVIARVQKKLQEAHNAIDTAAVRTRAIERKLRDVQELPPSGAEKLIGPIEPLPADEPETPETPEA